MLRTRLLARAALARGFAGPYRPPMLRPVLLLSSLALSLACSPGRNPGSTSGSTGEEPTSSSSSTSGTGASGTVATDTSSSGDASSSDVSETSGSGTAVLTTGTDESSGSTAPSGSSTGERGPICGDAVVDQGEQCDIGQETKLCDGDCTYVACGDLHVNAAAGEECDDGNVDDADACLATCKAAGCGDGIIQAGAEECDDGNAVETDGCDTSCKVHERWTNVGVAKDVPMAELHLWTQCYSASYADGGAIADVEKKCDGDHIMVACRMAGSAMLSIAAHAPRGDVFYVPQVNPGNGERHNANGVGWYWSPAYKVVGFGPEGNNVSCTKDGDSSRLCWFGLINQTFDAAGRCGSIFAIDANGTKTLERVVFEAWD